MYEKLDRSIDGNAWEGDGLDPRKLHGQIAAMRATDFMALQRVTLNSYDRVTRRAVCSAEAHFQLRPSDKTDDAIATVVGSRGLGVGREAFVPDPFENISYEVQPEADGAADQVMVASGADDALRFAMAIAIVRQLQSDGRLKTS